MYGGEDTPHLLAGRNVHYICEEVRKPSPPGQKSFFLSLSPFSFLFVESLSLPICWGCEICGIVEFVNEMDRGEREKQTERERERDGANPKKWALSSFLANATREGKVRRSRSEDPVVVMSQSRLLSFEDIEREREREWSLYGWLSQANCPTNFTMN